jgi:hypothetical protein
MLPPVASGYWIWKSTGKPLEALTRVFSLIIINFFIISLKNFSAEENIEGDNCEYYEWPPFPHTAVEYFIIW